MDPEITERLAKLWQVICQLNPKQRLDMKRMYKHCEKIFDNLSNELVICRRLGQNTAKYYKLKQELEESLSDCEHYLTLAALLE